MKVRDKIKNAICGESRNISVSKYKKNRKYAKRKYSVLKYGLLTVVAFAALLGGIYSYFGGLGTGKCANINEFKKYAVTVENLSIPEQAKIVALGEAIHLADVLLQNMELGKYIDNAGEINIHRDKMMAENIMWILKQEEARGNGRIFISGHNGHVKKSGNYDANNKVMGNLLADEIGNEYFVMGTDFYKTTCNFPVDESGKRKNHIFYSYDPMAKASKKSGFDISYLDFEKIPDSSELKKQVSECSWMGSLGEIYSALYRILPRGYRVWASPAELYDAMIYVSDAHPIEVIKD